MTVAEDLEAILDVFTGADGGVSYIATVAALRDLEKKAATGDEAAKEIILLVHRFRKMLDVLGKKH